MIVKSYESNKLDFQKNKSFLLYGENQGHKEEIIKNNFKKFFLENTYYYEENEIIKDVGDFYDKILSKSFFEKEKLIIINRVSDKLTNIIEEIIEKKIDDIVFVLNANVLEKKSKIRSFFEKNKDVVCIPFYKDSSQTLSGLAGKFLKEKKIPISQQSINLIVQRSSGDRKNLLNELEKIQGLSKRGGGIRIEDISKITNLAENYDASELIDSCLSKNIRKTIHILNENNYSLEDCILIIRTFLIKTKRLTNLCAEAKKTQNIDNVISNYKPPIFWKEKDIVKQQIKNWSHGDIKNLIFQINEIELLIKKHSSNSINILSDFIIEKASPINSLT